MTVFCRDNLVYADTFLIPDGRFIDQLSLR